MRKINNKGFTLIEILVVVAIIGLLVSIAIPAISRTIYQSRKNIFISVTSSAIDSIKDDLLANDYGAGNIYYLNSGCYNKDTYEKIDITEKDNCLLNNGDWHQYSINDLLDKDMINSPFGSKFSEASYIEILDENDDEKLEYNICITDGVYGIQGSNNNLEESFGEMEICSLPKNY